MADLKEETSEDQLEQLDQDQPDQDLDESEAPADEGAEEKEDEPKSRGERKHERYIDKLSKEISESANTPDTYTEEIFAPDKSYQPVAYKEGEEYDPKALEEDRLAFGKNQFSQGIQTGLQQGTQRVNLQVWDTNFDIDSERVTNKYEVLNPESKNYNPDVERDLVQGYVQFTGMEKDDKGRITIQKPNVRFKDYVEAEVGKMERYAAIRQAESSKNIVKQAAQTGVRPSGQARTSKGGHGFDPNDPVNSVNQMTKEQYFELGGKEASDAYLAKRLTR